MACDGNTILLQPVTTPARNTLIPQRETFSLAELAPCQRMMVLMLDTGCLPRALASLTDSGAGLLFGRATESAWIRTTSGPCATLFRTSRTWITRGMPYSSCNAVSSIHPPIRNQNPATSRPQQVLQGPTLHSLPTRVLRQE